MGCQIEEREGRREGQREGKEGERRGQKKREKTDLVEEEGTQEVETVWKSRKESG